MWRLPSLACLLLAAIAIHAQTLDQQPYQPATGEPELPVIDFKACGSGDRPLGPFKITRPQQMYSTWQDKRASVGALIRGGKLTMIGGVNITRKPARAVIRNLVWSAPIFVPGDAVLGYGYDADGTIAFWGKGVRFTEYAEHVAAKGYDCGFADKSECTIDIVENGVSEWWVHVKTANGLTGWVLGATVNGDKSWNSGNFGQMCQD